GGQKCCGRGAGHDFPFGPAHRREGKITANTDREPARLQAQGRLGYASPPAPRIFRKARMAGHSKWANIQHRKGKADKAKARLFSKLAKEITVAAKTGMADPALNPRLRLAVNNAQAASMPMDNIQRAIDKRAGGDGANYEAIRY